MSNTSFESLFLLLTTNFLVSVTTYCLLTAYSLPTLFLFSTDFKYKNKLISGNSIIIQG